MPLVEASVYSIIAVARENYCRANSEAIFLQLHYIKQMISKLQKTAEKRKHSLDPLKVKHLFIFLWEAWARQLAGIEASHISSLVVMKWKVNFIDILHAPAWGAEFEVKIFHIYGDYKVSGRVGNNSVNYNWDADILISLTKISVNLHYVARASFVLFWSWLCVLVSLWPVQDVFYTALCCLGC